MTRLAEIKHKLDHMGFITVRDGNWLVEQVERMRAVLASVEWVQDDVELYCPFCAATCNHRDGCEWVKAMEGTHAERTTNP